MTSRPVVPPAAREVAELCVVDLASSAGATPVVRALATRAARRALRSAGHKGRCGLLVHGDEGARAVARGLLPTVRPADILDAAALAEVHAWVERVSGEVVDGSGRSLFPTVDGVHFGDLARLELQNYLFDFALLARSALKMLDSAAPRRVDIIAAERDRAAALASLLSPVVPQVRVRWVPLIRSIRGAATRLAAWRHRPGRKSVSPPALLARGESALGILTVSETAPMAETFAAVERHLDLARCGPVVRAQFGNGAEVPTPARVVRLGRPGTIPATRRGRFADEWKSIRHLAAGLDVRAPLASRDLAAPLMTILQRFFTERFDTMAEQLAYADAMLAEARPGLLVVGNDRWYAGQAFVQVARRMGIPSVCVQDGVASDTAFWRWVGADLFVASSDDVAEVFRRSGVPDERLEVSGQPRYDDLCGMRGQQAGPSRASLGIPADGPVVLFASQSHQTAAYADEVVGAILRVPGVKLLLRPHPAEPADKYDGYAARHPGRVFGARGRDLQTMLLASDVVVVESSTVGLEAAILGRPVITANFAGTPTLIPYAERGLAMRARNGAELTAALEAVIASGLVVPNGALEGLVGPLDGRSSERAAHSIMRAAERGSARSSGVLAAAGA